MIRTKTLKTLAITALILSTSVALAGQLTLQNLSSGFATYASFDSSGNHLDSGNCGSYKTCTLQIPDTTNSITLTLHFNHGPDFERTYYSNQAFSNKKISCSFFGWWSPEFSCPIS